MTKIPLSFPDMLFRPEELAGCLPKLKAAGFAGIELAYIGCDKPEYFSLTREIARMARTKGFRIGTLWVHKVRGACSGDLQVRRAAIEKMKRIMELSAELNAAGVITIDHCADVEGMPATREAAADCLRETYHELGREAVRLGTRIFVEPLARENQPLLETIESATQFCRNVGVDGVRVCADTYHARANGEDYIAALKQAKGCVGYIHFSDFRPAAGKAERPLPGFGEIRFDAVFQAVASLGYRNLIAIEGAIPQGMSALAACEETARRLFRAAEPSVD